MGNTQKRLQVAVVGLGRLGQACALALLDESELALAGIVRRPASAHAALGRLQRTPVVSHVRDLPKVDVALVCVPAPDVSWVAHDLLQAGIPVVECARLKRGDRAVHDEELAGAARKFKTPAIWGAGWDPGVLPLLNAAFNTLIPRGHTVQHEHPGIALHHSAAVAHVPGIKDALEGELLDRNGSPQRYVYVELQPGAHFETVRAHISADPLFAGEAVQVFEMDTLGELEDGNHEGIVVERMATAAAGTHASLVLEARFDACDFAARVMLDAARRVVSLPAGAHPYSLASTIA